MARTAKYGMFVFLIFFCQNVLSQDSLSGTWYFDKISSKDSIIIDVSQRSRLRDFVIKTRKIDLNRIPLNLLDTVNRIIDKDLDLIANSFIKLKPNNRFEIVWNEILIPKATPGIVIDSILHGRWKYNPYSQIVTFQMPDGFQFLYKIISVGKRKLLAGIIHSENQNPQFISAFIRR